MQSRDTVAAVFDERQDAQDAIDELRRAGFRAEDVGVVARDPNQHLDTVGSSGHATGEGATIGAVAGGVLGGLGAWLVGLGSLAIPVVGPVIAAGAFATALVGTVAGAAVGAIVGGLGGMGIPAAEADWYEERVRGGAWLVTVKAGGRYDEARRIVHDYGGHDYESGRMTTYRPWGEASPAFRSSYERQYGSGSFSQDYEPAHRFGYESYGRMRQGTARDWSSAEADLRRDWESQGVGTWEANRGHIRHGFDYGRGRTRFRDQDEDVFTGQTDPLHADTGRS